ncbi:SMP-30/gluconolactonase/LRE family protein [Mycobacterium heckeshornense]|uniref:SMP-30/gluconolactonase/LRE family protein n=1 Tax=Mycobacterium heckeshornense TaxID=110505 RepID=UPI00066299FC|nr:SMP-30/gluconolactonase/LRE family protein [Mycobacterium heckeshornense]KMV16576.1 hypothetical protein ACT16_22160 [Mycobacterium heckeshornense]
MSRSQAGTALAVGLRFPESPLWCPDGSVVVVEIESGRVVSAREGAIKVVAECGGGPNAVAFGPDGALYVANNGGLSFREVPARGWLFPGDRATDWLGGSVQRVDPASGAVTVLYDAFQGRQLRAPCDLVFDGTGGFWFTDHGHSYGEIREWGCVYYARADGSSLTQVLPRMDTPNGIGLAPDGTTLYVAETNPARLWAFALSEPGVLDPVRHGAHRQPRYGGRVLHGMGGYHLFDSLAVDAHGNVNVATMGEHTGIAVVSPDGGLLTFVDVDDPAVTNLCFGGPGLRTAFITLSASGRVVALDWPRPGLQLAHQEYA